MLLLCLLLAQGCAPAPRARSGAEARTRFLMVHAAPHGPTRGVAPISVKRDDGTDGGARVRWAANAESLALIGYVGPSRALDASLLRDSIYVVVRHFGLGVAGSLRRERDVSPRMLRFIATPWDFGAAWVRDAVEHAAIQENGNEWLLLGTFPAGRSARVVRFALEISPKGEPVRLTLRRDRDAADFMIVRYGPVRRFEAGTIPRWTEWKLPGSTVRLTVEDYAPADPGKIRYAPPPEPDWHIRSLDEPDGRMLVRWLLGLSEEESGS